MLVFQIVSSTHHHLGVTLQAVSKEFHPNKFNKIGISIPQKLWDGELYPHFGATYIVNSSVLLLTKLTDKILIKFLGIAE